MNGSQLCSLPHLPVRKCFLCLLPLSLQFPIEIFSSSLFFLKFTKVMELRLVGLKSTFQLCKRTKSRKMIERWGFNSKAIRSLHKAELDQWF